MTPIFSRAERKGKGAYIPFGARRARRGCFTGLLPAINVGA